jgi:hypothetical protein
VRNEEKTGLEMTKLLIAQRSDPEFLGLTKDGEDSKGHRVIYGGDNDD